LTASTDNFNRNEIGHMYTPCLGCKGISDVVVVGILIATGYHPMVPAFDAFIEYRSLIAIRKCIRILKLNKGWIVRTKSVDIDGSAPIIGICNQNRIKTLENDRNRSPGRNCG